MEFETNVEDLDSEAGSDFWLVRFLYKNKKQIVIGKNNSILLKKTQDGAN